MSTESPAETVRRAASLLRERAMKARDDGWTEPTTVEGVEPRVLVAGNGIRFVGDFARASFAQHAAGLPPAEGLLIAEAWVHQAIDMDAANAVIEELILAGPTSEPAVVAVDSCHTGMRADWTATWIAARAYLRETS